MVTQYSKPLRGWYWTKEKSGLSWLKAVRPVFQNPVEVDQEAIRHERAVKVTQSEVGAKFTDPNLWCG